MNLDTFMDLEEALSYLRQQQYLHMFRCNHQGWQCLESGEEFLPEELAMETCHRFNRSGGRHAPTVLYVVTTPQGKKGAILDNHSTYGNSLQGDYLVKMKLQQLLPAVLA